MARERKDRFRELVDAATRVFIRSGGFKRTQIKDVADAMGVSKGLVYHYVESKEALFDLALRYADHPEKPAPEALPVPTPEPGSTMRYVRELLAAQSPLPVIEKAAARPGPENAITDELGELADAIYDVLSRNRRTIRLIGSSAHDLPELAELWYGEGRGALNRRLARYLAARADSGHLSDAFEPTAAARHLTETAHWFAVTRHWDLYPDAIGDDTARFTVRLAMQQTFLPWSAA